MDRKQDDFRLRPVCVLDARGSRPLLTSESGERTDYRVCRASVLTGYDEDGRPICYEEDVWASTYEEQLMRMHPLSIEGKVRMAVLYNRADPANWR
jgi:hypothetical protein